MTLLAFIQIRFRISSAKPQNLLGTPSSETVAAHNSYKRIGSLRESNLPPEAVYSQSRLGLGSWFLDRLIDVSLLHRLLILDPCQIVRLFTCGEKQHLDVRRLPSIPNLFPSAFEPSRAVYSRRNPHYSTHLALAHLVDCGKVLDVKHVLFSDLPTRFRGVVVFYPKNSIYFASQKRVRTYKVGANVFVRLSCDLAEVEQLIRSFSCRIPLDALSSVLTKEP